MTIDFDFEDLSEEELDEILIYAESKKNLGKRYVVACQIIANMTKELDFDSFSNTEMIDLSICKLIIDGYIEVEEENRKIH